MSADAMITVDNASFSFPGKRWGTRRPPVLSDINLTLDAGNLLAVLGPNGVGKTTLLKCVLGLLPWTSGRTLLDGTDITALRSSVFWSRVAYVPQARNAGSLSLSGLDMVLLGRSAHLGLTSQPGPGDRRIAMAVLERIGVGHLAAVPCGQMSGGQFQMILIARALATGPRMLVLDEPETGLDFRNQLIVLTLLRQLAVEESMLVVMNTHYPAHALRVADRALLLRPGASPLFGATGEVVTEAHLRDTFGVEIALTDTVIDGQTHRGVLPVRIV